MAASNAGAFRGARMSSTWIPRGIRNIIVCSQTLYFFKGFIDRQRKEVVVGEEKNRRSIFFFLALRAPRSRARELDVNFVFEKNEKKNKTTSVYRLGI